MDGRRRLRDLARFYCVTSPSVSETQTFESTGNGESALGADRNEFRPRQPVLATDPVLTTLAQSTALRLKCERCLISLIDDKYQHIIAEATRSISPYDASNHDEGDGLMLGVQALPNNWGVCSTILSAFIGGETIRLEDPNNIANKDAVVISDLRAEGRACLIPVVRGDTSRLRFYIGVPLLSESGYCIGVVCLFDPIPRSANPHDVANVQISARTIAQYLMSMRIRANHGRAERLLQGMSQFLQGEDSIAQWTVNHQAGPVLTAQEIDTTSDSGLELTEWQQPSTASLPPYFQIERHEASSQVSDGCTISPRSIHFSTGSENLSAVTTPATSTLLTGSISEDLEQINLESERQNTHSSPGDATDTLFARASNLIRESLDLDGTCFLEVPPNDRYRSRFGSRSCKEIPRDGTTPDDSSLDSASASDAEISGRFCRLIGLSQRFSESRSKRPSPLTEVEIKVSLLAQLSARYSKGHVFYFDKDGGVSSEDEISSEVKTRNSRARAGRISDQLLGKFPGVRSLIFVPLFDNDSQQIYAGFLGWSITLAQSLQTQDLLYVSGFAYSIMGEVMRLQTVATDKVKSDFISSMSHELRSPLHGILLANQLLAEGKDSSEQSEYIQTVDICARTLLDVMNHLLDHTKINNMTGAKKFFSDTRKHQYSLTPSQSFSLVEKVELSSLIEDTVATVTLGDRWAMHKFHATVASDVANVCAVEDKRTSSTALPILLNLQSLSDLRFKTEAGSWRRIVMNLLGNSLKFTSLGFVAISLNVRKSSRRPCYTHVAELRIKDTGRGISDDFLKHRLFTPFAQENNLSVGTGLGLSLVKRMVTLMQGSIHVASEVGIGTDITIRLPLTAVASPTSAMIRPYERLKGLTFSICEGPSAFLRTDAASKNSEHSSNAWIFTRRVLNTTLIDWLGLRLSTREKADIIVVEHSTFLADSSKYDVPGTKVLIVDMKFHLANEHTAILAHAKGSIVASPIGPRTIINALQQLLDSSDTHKSSRIQKEIAMPQYRRQATHSEQRKSKGLTFSTRPSMRPKSLSEADSPTPLVTETAEHVQEAILLVDDNDINLRLLLATIARLEKAAPSQYITATNGKEALDRYQEAVDSGIRVKTVFMDISMPVMDGIQSTRAIRALEFARGLDNSSRAKIVALTGLASAKSRAEIAESGADTYLCKPATVKSIREVLTA